MRPKSVVRKVSDRATAWLRGTVWPLWLERGVDWKLGAFHEHLDPKDLSCDANFRRLRVAARQVYTFARAAEFDVPRASEAVALGLEFLERNAQQRGGGYARVFDLAGNTIDETLSLYDQAFTLLAFAETARREDALALIDFIETHFRHPQGGYVESLPPKGPRRQNTHMHLFEACLAAAERFKDAVFFNVAKHIFEVFVTRLFQPARGVLPEDFDQNLCPIEKGERYVIEPGHHCEWVWLIARYSAVVSGWHRSHAELVEISAALMSFTDQHGTHPDRGTLFDALWNDGSIHTATSRLWPQTERLKAEAFRPAATAGRVADAYAALAVHVGAGAHGLWREHLAADGSWESEPAPASSLYHLTCGILETGAAIRANRW